MNIKIELKFICSLSHSLGRLPFKKKYQNKWWWKTWRNWKLHALLVGMYSHYEKQYVVPQNIKNKVTIWFSNSTFVDILNWKKGLKYLYTALFTITKKMETTQTSTNKWTDIQNVVQSSFSIQGWLIPEPQWTPRSMNAQVPYTKCMSSTISPPDPQV